MLYDTHKRYGQAFGLATMPLMNEVGVLNSDGLGMGVVGLVGLCGVAFYGSMFGAKFPDFDSPTSRAASEHKIISGLFRAFGVKHRGKFSHDLLVQTILWVLLYVLVGTLDSHFSFVGSEQLFTVLSVFVAFSYVGVVSHLFADSITVEGVWFAGIIKIRLMPVWIRHFGLGKFKPFRKAFTTASEWNNVNYKVMSFLVPILVVYAVGGVFFF